MAAVSVTRSIAISITFGNVSHAMTANKPAKKCILFGLFSRLCRCCGCAELASHAKQCSICEDLMENVQRNRRDFPRHLHRGSHRENKTGQTFLLGVGHIIKLSFNQFDGQLLVSLTANFKLHLHSLEKEKKPLKEKQPLNFSF